MTFDEWWDTTKAAATPDTFAGWEASCRQAWRAGQIAERERCAAVCDIVAARTTGPQRRCCAEDLARAIRLDQP